VPLNLLHISSHVVHHADISKCLQLGVGKIYTLPWPVEPVDSLFFFKQYWDLNSGPCTCLAGALLLEPLPALYGVQSISKGCTHIHRERERERERQSREIVGREEGLLERTDSSGC
jgi:hypothetical protein